MSVFNNVDLYNFQFFLLKKIGWECSYLWAILYIILILLIYNNVLCLSYLNNPDSYNFQLFYFKKSVGGVVISNIVYIIISFNI